MNSHIVATFTGPLLPTCKGTLRHLKANITPDGGVSILILGDSHETWMDTVCLTGIWNVTVTVERWAQIYTQVSAAPDFTVTSGGAF